MARTASRAFLWTTVLEVDSAERRVVFTPSRWFGALFAPAFAVTPAALLWIETQGLCQLTGGGWIIAIGYAVIAAVSAVMFLSPHNRYVALELAQGHLVMGGPWGIGQPVEVALADVPITYTETARQNQATRSTAASCSRRSAVAATSSRTSRTRPPTSCASWRTSSRSPPRGRRSTSARSSAWSRRTRAARCCARWASRCSWWCPA